MRSARPRPKGRQQPGRLPERDFDLGRAWDCCADDQAAAVTAVLVTSGDSELDWLRPPGAERLLCTPRASGPSPVADPGAASGGNPTLIRGRLALPGPPQLLLQFGWPGPRARSAVARRPT